MSTKETTSEYYIRELEDLRCQLQDGMTHMEADTQVRDVSVEQQQQQVEKTRQMCQIAIDQIDHALHHIRKCRL